jgi:hypothetical protein
MVLSARKCQMSLLRGRGSQAEKAWALYEEMKTIDNVSPNGQTYNHLITASCKVGSPETRLVLLLAQLI